MSISLSPEIERLIEEKVESGEYDSADEVVRDALRALSAAEQDHANRLEALRAKIQEGIDDLENGRHSPLEEVVARLRERRSVPLAT
jgi:antitoxin ParD1/3/4